GALILPRTRTRPPFSTATNRDKFVTILLLHSASSFRIPCAGQGGICDGVNREANRESASAHRTATRLRPRHPPVDGRRRRPVVRTERIVRNDRRDGQG